VLDIAPTVFHLLGEPVPRGLDGRVAVEACLPDYQQVAYTAASDETAMPTDGEAFDGAEGQDEMRRRLRALGYID
jgi:arylsulfatase A-like enzyme